MYKYIIFDFDGTLADTKEGIINAASYALSKYGLQPEYDELKRFIGPSLWYSFDKFYGFDKDKQTEAVTYYRQYYNAKGMYEACLYDGVKYVLEKIKESGRFVAIASSKVENSVINALKYFDIFDYFDIVKGSAPDGSRSDKTLLISDVIKQTNICSMSDAVYIGDSITDYYGAEALGIDFIAALYDRDVSEFKGVNLTKKADSIQDILNFL